MVKFPFVYLLLGFQMAIVIKEKSIPANVGLFYIEQESHLCLIGIHRYQKWSDHNLYLSIMWI